MADLKSTRIFWRAVFALLWMAGSAILGAAYPEVLPINLLGLPAVFHTRFLPWPFDQAGAAIAGIIVSTILGPAMFGLAYHPAAGVVSKLTVVGTLIGLTIAAMVLGFGVGRWVAHEHEF